MIVMKLVCDKYEIQMDINNRVSQLCKDAAKVAENVAS